MLNMTIREFFQYHVNSLNKFLTDITDSDTYLNFNKFKNIITNGDYLISIGLIVLILAILLTLVS